MTNDDDADRWQIRKRKHNGKSSAKHFPHLKANNAPITTSFSRQIQICLFDVLFSDVNECADVSVHQCMHNCVDTLTGYYCTCDKGFRLLSNGKTCRGMALLLFEYFTGKLELSRLSRLVRKNFSLNRIDTMNCLEPLVEINCGINYFFYCRITSSNAIVEELLVKRLNLSVL